MPRPKVDRAEAIESLRRIMPEGSTVYTTLRRVSSSGMSRCISLVVLATDDNGRPFTLHPNYSAGVILGMPRVSVNGSDALRINGCGMDMGFDMVYQLSYALYGRGDALKQQWI